MDPKFRLKELDHTCYNKLSGRERERLNKEKEKRITSRLIDRYLQKTTGLRFDKQGRKFSYVDHDGVRFTNSRSIRVDKKINISQSKVEESLLKELIG